MRIEINHNQLTVQDLRELSAVNAREVKEKVTQQFAECLTAIAFDASQLTFIDSSGLGVLISLQKATALRSGRFSILDPSSQTRQILELTRLHRVFDIESSP